MAKEIFFFDGEILGNKSGAWVEIPDHIVQHFKIKGQLKVKATFNGEPYRGSIANMGKKSHILIVVKAIRQKIEKEVGDIISVSVEKDTEKREVEVPAELQELLKNNPASKSFFDSLSYTNRKEYAQWIASAKKQETKQKRLKETVRRLNAGIKNPFEK